MNKRVFIVGAGFSHYLSGNRFPLGNELSEIVRALNIDELERHFQGCTHEPPHLEEVLTRLQLDRNLNLQRKKQIEKQVFLAVQGNLTVKSLDDKIPDYSEDLIKNLFLINDVIITTNYDLLLDHLLDKTGLWSPLGNGYGNAIEGDDPLLHIDCDKVNQSLKNIRLLKIHGSFNFFEQPFTSGEMSDSISVLVNDTHRDFLDKGDLFPSSSHNHHDPGKKADNLRAIVLPTFIKPFAQNRTTMKMWHEAQEAMRHASVISIIGYSFPEPDQMMSFLLSCPAANEFASNGRKLNINILNTKDEIKTIRKHITRFLRANPDKHVDWGEFDLDSGTAYDNLLEALNAFTRSPLA